MAFLQENDQEQKILFVPIQILPKMLVKVTLVELYSLYLYVGWWGHLLPSADTGFVSRDHPEY